MAGFSKRHKSVEWSILWPHLASLLVRSFNLVLQGALDISYGSSAREGMWDEVSWLIRHSAREIVFGTLWTFSHFFLFTFLHFSSYFFRYVDDMQLILIFGVNFLCTVSVSSIYLQWNLWGPFLPFAIILFNLTWAEWRVQKTGSIMYRKGKESGF